MICDDCAYYDYDEEQDCYVCIADLDEDELYAFLQGGNNVCRYYNPYDEYKIVEKQTKKKELKYNLMIEMKEVKDNV